MRHIPSTLAAAVALALPAIGLAANTGTISQNGTNLTAHINQAAGNSAVATATITQTGDAQHATASQEAGDYTATLTQSNASNTASSSQLGAGGAASSVSVAQSGTGESATIVVDNGGAGGNDSTVTSVQTGTDSMIDVALSGTGNLVEVTQEGLGAIANVTVTDSHDTKSYIIQDGDSAGMADIDVLHSSDLVVLRVTQSAVDMATTARIEATDADASSLDIFQENQSGSSATIFVNDGDGNTIGIGQFGASGVDNVALIDTIGEHDSLHILQELCTSCDATIRVD